MTEDRPTPLDPDVGPAPPRLRWWIVLLAGAASLTGWLVAPDAWPEGPAVLSVVYRDVSVVEETVVVGSDDPVTAAGEAVDATVEIEIPDGVPADQQTVAHVRVTVDGRTVRPALEDVVMSLRIGDGEERIPAVRWDPNEGRLVAARRPPVDAGVVLAALGLVVVLWVSEAVPLFIASLLVPVILVVAGTAPAVDALAPFFHPIIALFFGGFLMAEAMRRVGLDHWAAVGIVARGGHSPFRLFLVMAATASFLSMWMSNTAATAVLVPIAIAVTEPLDDLRYRKVVVLGIAYAATIGGVGSAIGTPANPLAIEFLDSFAGRSISFVGWFAYGLPMVVLLLPVMTVYLWRRGRVRVDRSVFHDVREAAIAEARRLGRPTRDQLVVLAVFAGVMAVWLTQTWHGLDTGIVAVAGAVALALLGKIEAADLGRISWNALITFGGGLTLGVFLTETGTADWIATRLVGLASIPAAVGVGIIAAITLALTTVASNTATAAMMVPLSIPLAGVLGVDPVTLVIVVAIASSIDFALVIGTPPTMIAYATRLYTTREIFRTGIALDAVGVLLLVTAVAGLWSLFGLV